MAKLRPNANPDWMNDAWKYRKIVTINNTVNPFLLSDQQVKIQLNSVVFDFSKAKANGEDIRFTASDGVTPLSYWITPDYNSGTQTGTIWVKVPTVPQSSTTDIYMYYGNAAAPDASGAGVVVNLHGTATHAPSFPNWSFAFAL
jgi:biopolymer transport protein ExbB